MYSCHVKWSTDRNVRSKQENTFGACGQEKAMLPVSSIGGERGVAHRCELRSIDPTSSAVRQLGDTLYNLRITAGLTQQQLAALTGGRWSRSHIGRVENGDVTPSPGFVEAMDGLLGGDRSLVQCLPRLLLETARQRSQRQWQRREPSTAPPSPNQETEELDQSALYTRPGTAAHDPAPAASHPAVSVPGPSVASPSAPPPSGLPPSGPSPSGPPTWTRPTSARFRARGAGTDRTGTEGSGIEVHRQPVTVPPYDPVDRARRRHGVGAPHPAGGGPRGRPGHPRAARAGGRAVRASVLGHAGGRAVRAGAAVPPARRRHARPAPARQPAAAPAPGRRLAVRAARQPLVPPRRLPPGQDAPRDRLAARPGGRPQRPGRMGARRAEHGRAV